MITDEVFDPHHDEKLAFCISWLNKSILRLEKGKIKPDASLGLKGLLKIAETAGLTGDFLRWIKERHYFNLEDRSRIERRQQPEYVMSELSHYKKLMSDDCIDLYFNDYEDELREWIIRGIFSFPDGRGGIHQLLVEETNPKKAIRKARDTWGEFHFSQIMEEVSRATECGYRQAKFDNELGRGYLGCNIDNGGCALEGYHCPQEGKTIAIPVKELVLFHKV